LHGPRHRGAWALTSDQARRNATNIADTRAVVYTAATTSTVISGSCQSPALSFNAPIIGALNAARTYPPPCTNADMVAASDAERDARISPVKIRTNPLE